MRVDSAVVVESSPTVYRPAEDSYLLLSAVDIAPEERFLEVGTGTGLVAIHAARAARLAVATDANPDAVRLARRNAAANRVPLIVVRCDLMAPIRGPFDVVAFNPPYLPGWPMDELDRAWSGGAEGSEAAVRFLADLPRILAPEGRGYLVLSRANRTARNAAARSFEVRLVAGKDLWSERLEVLELRKSAGPRQGAGHRR